jgi:hypothetical protein
MDAWEITGCVLKGVGWTALGGVAYIATLVGVHIISNRFTESIKSQEDLDRITLEEAKRLGIEEPITAILLQRPEGVARLLDFQNHQIEIGGYEARRGTVRHELYHVYRGHTRYRRRKINGLLYSIDYWFRMEPQAIAYEVFRLKI